MQNFLVWTILNAFSALLLFYTQMKTLLGRWCFSTIFPRNIFSLFIIFCISNSSLLNKSFIRSLTFKQIELEEYIILFSNLEMICSDLFYTFTLRGILNFFWKVLSLIEFVKFCFITVWSRWDFYAGSLHSLSLSLSL